MSSQTISAFPGLFSAPVMGDDFTPAADVEFLVDALDALKLDRDPQVHVLDLWVDFSKADGTLKKELYSDGPLHLGPAGYEEFASKLKPLVERLLK